MSMNSALSDRFIAERLHSLHRLLSWNAAPDQLQITHKLIEEYRQEAVERGLDPDKLIMREERKAAALFARQIFVRKELR